MSTRALVLGLALAVMACTSEPDEETTSSVEDVDAAPSEVAVDDTRTSALIARPAPATDLRDEAAAASDLERIEELHGQLDAEVLEGETAVSLPGDVLFDFDDEAVTSAGRSTLADVAELIELEEPVEVLVEGHTDSVGSAAYNQDLSERRAASVAQVLVDGLDVDIELIETRGAGPDQPVASNTTDAGEDDPEGRALNRRVEVILDGS